MATLKIITGTDQPILRTKTTAVPTVTKEVKKLLKDMVDTVIEANGVGLAAPQVGQTERVCIVFVNRRYMALINPEITWKSDETDTMEEGCLSLPNVWLKVTRPVGIKLKYQDAKGAEHELKLEGFDARVVQHEVDHLDGVLILDRASIA